MPRKTIIRYREDDELYLGYRDDYHDGEEATDLTLEELADLCDQGAESSNAHDFIGAHRLLAALLHHRLGRVQATTILREIAELGGLDGMNGICGAGDAYGDMGIPEPWKDWKLG